MIALIEQQKASIVEACQKFGVQRLEVFGSAARGDFNAQKSDLDLIAKFIPPLHPGVADRFFWAGGNPGKNFRPTRGPAD